MIDFRKKVKEDRGFLKKIELAIPGFRGYRKREDLRIADNLLRTHIADEIKNVSLELEEYRKILTKNMELDVLGEIGSLINHVNAIEGKVRHAEHGYAGISPDYRIDETEINKLYEWDLNLITHIKNMQTLVKNLSEDITSSNQKSIIDKMNVFNNQLRKFDELFDKRRNSLLDLGG